MYSIEVINAMNEKAAKKAEKKKVEKMVVKAIWEFEFDDTEYDQEFIDIERLAVESAQNELNYLIRNGDIVAYDFNYIVEKE